MTICFIFLMMSHIIEKWTCIGTSLTDHWLIRLIRCLCVFVCVCVSSCVSIYYWMKRVRVAWDVKTKEGKMCYNSNDETQWCIDDASMNCLYTFIFSIIWLIIRKMKQMVIEKMKCIYSLLNTHPKTTNRTNNSQPQIQTDSQTSTHT